MLELFVAVLPTHVLCKIFEITTSNIYHLFLSNSFTWAFWLYFSSWSIVLDTILAVESSILFAIFFLYIFRHYVLVVFAVALISFLQIGKVLVILKIKESRIIMLIKVLLGRLISLSLLLNF